jgi:hypothetical protein
MMRAFFAGPVTTAGVVLAAVTLSLAAPAPARADLEVKGAVSQVLLPPDPAAGPFGAVTLADGTVETQVFVVADTQITVAGAAAALADVHVGDTAEVKYVATTTEAGDPILAATRIKVERSVQPLFGLVTQVAHNALDPSVVDVTVDPPTDDPITLQVSAGTAVKVGDRTVALLSLKAEQLASLRGSYATARYTEGPSDSNPASEVRFRKALRLPFKGVVQEATGNTLTLAVGEGESLTLEVGGQTRARLNGSALKNLTELTAGDLCHGIFVMTLDPNPEALHGHCYALQLVAKWPHPVPYSGTIAAVNGPGGPVSTARRGKSGSVGGDADVEGSLVLALPDGTTQVQPIVIYKQTRIKVNGKPGTFGGLQVGQRCHVLCIPRADGYHCIRLEAKKPPASGG